MRKVVYEFFWNVMIIELAILSLLGETVSLV